MNNNSDFPFDAGDGEETFWFIAKLHGLGFWRSWLGWVPFREATKYSNADRANLSLPVAGYWVRAEDLKGRNE